MRQPIPWTLATTVWTLELGEVLAMFAQLATQQQLAWPRLGRATNRLLESVLIVATGMSLIMAMLLFARRLTGQLQQPLEPSALIFAGLVLATFLSLLRAGCLRVCSVNIPQHALLTALLWLLPSLTLLLLGVAMTISGSSYAALALFWLCILGTDVTWWLSAWKLKWFSLRAPDELAPTAATASPRDQSSQSESNATEPELERLEDESLEDESLEEADDESELLPPGVTQQLTRSKDDHGRETMAGLLREFFRSGERSRSLHVAFCPPLQGRPTVSVVQIAGPNSRIKAAEVHPYGVRFDLRLTTPCTADDKILIHFEAQETNPT